MEAASDRLYAQAPEQHEQVRRPSPDRLVPPVSHEHRRADALALVAESALQAGLDPGTRGDRYQVVIHVDEPVLRDVGPGQPPMPGMSMLEDGIDVSAETSRRHTCDCATVEMTHDADGNTLDVGRRTRTISPAMRRALRYRDQSCRFPGCGVTVCEGHHVKHWADGGETKLDNLMLLCRRHHRAVHEEGHRVELQPDGEAIFYDETGHEIPNVPPTPELDSDAAWQLLEYAEPDGVPIDHETGGADTDGVRLDWGYVIDVMYEREEQADVGGYEAADADGEERTGNGEATADAGGEEWTGHGEATADAGGEEEAHAGSEDGASSGTPTAEAAEVEAESKPDVSAETRHLACSPEDRTERPELGTPADDPVEAPTQCLPPAAAADHCPRVGVGHFNASNGGSGRSSDAKTDYGTSPVDESWILGMEIIEVLQTELRLTPDEWRVLTDDLRFSGETFPRKREATPSRRREPQPSGQEPQPNTGES
jgi:hypothetical protein